MANPILAGTMITRLREKIPDGVWLAGVPQPTVDGKFRVQTLYAWLDDAVKTLTQLTGWTIDDWWAMPQVATQPWYEVNDLFVSMEDAFSSQWSLSVSVVNEGDTIWPNSLGPISTQPLAAYVRRLAAALEVGVWPTPVATDPVTTLTNPLTTAADPIVVASTAGFLSFGYIQIESEIIQYQGLNADGVTLNVISRGIGGTTPVAHLAAVPVRHLALWIKGKRLPNPIANSLSPVEVPRGWMAHLETYVLGQCRITQKRHGEGQALLADFEKACKGINADPNWKVNEGRIRAYGEPVVGPLFGYGQGLIVP